MGLRAGRLGRSGKTRNRISSVWLVAAASSLHIARLLFLKRAESSRLTRADDSLVEYQRPS
jgi:hypothetical protein